MACLEPHSEVTGREIAHSPGVLLLLGLRVEAQGLVGSLLVNLKCKSGNLKHRRRKKQVAQMVSY